MYILHHCTLYSKVEYKGVYQVFKRGLASPPLPPNKPLI